VNGRLLRVGGLMVGIATVASIMTAPGTAWAGSADAVHSSHHSPVARCRPADLSAVLSLTPVGSASSSLAGAVVLADTSTAPCSLQGVPDVSVVGPTGQAIAAVQAPNFYRKVPAVTLRAAAASAHLPDAGSSITWSNWTCSKGSFALTVRFPGWKGSITVPWGTTTGYAGAPCTGNDASLYVGPVVRVAAPPA